MIARPRAIVAGTLRYARDMVSPHCGLSTWSDTAQLVQAEAAADDAAVKEALGDL